MSPNITASETLKTFPPKTNFYYRFYVNLNRTLKPLMEKRRRARINESLNQLKTLILPLMGKDSSRYSKLEKADILEMTVGFLKDLPQIPAQNITESYREGYRACLHRISNLLPNSDLLDRDTTSRLIEYLQRSMDLSTTSCCQKCNIQSFPKDLCQRIQSAVQFNPARGAQVPASPQSHQPLPRHQLIPQPQNTLLWRPW
uniref:Hes family bHLH transcription factor 2 n=1 Tax=Latimeria chalumnae TaxID=7897 RepID=H3BB93_LATCH